MSEEVFCSVCGGYLFFCNNKGFVCPVCHCKKVCSFYEMYCREVVEEFLKEPVIVPGPIEKDCRYCSLSYNFKKNKWEYCCVIDSDFFPECEHCPMSKKEG